MCNISQIMFPLNQNAQFLSIFRVKGRHQNTHVRDACVLVSPEMGRLRFGPSFPAVLHLSTRSTVWLWTRPGGCMVLVRGGRPCWRWTQDTGGVALGQHSPGTQVACLGHRERVTWVPCAPRVSVCRCFTHWMVKKKNKTLQALTRDRCLSTLQVTKNANFVT